MPLVVNLVLKQGLTIAIVGTSVGVALTMLVTKLLSKLLYGVAPHDPIIFGGVALILVVVAGLASLLPARRATRVDPLVALRTE